MTPEQEIELFYQHYRLLLDAGKQDEARSYMLREFSELSESARGRLLMEMMTIAMEDEVRQRDAITEMQELGLAALKAIDKIEAENNGGAAA